jgi:hypothetical protein
MTVSEAILVGIICALVGGFTGNRLRIGGDAAERRRLFRIQIDVLLATLRDTDDSYIGDFHWKTLKSVRDDCAEISSDVFWSRRRRKLNEAAQKYYHLAEVENRKDLQHIKGQGIYLGSDFPGRGHIQELLTKMSACAK